MAEAEQNEAQKAAALGDICRRAAAAHNARAQQLRESKPRCPRCTGPFASQVHSTYEDLWEHLAQAHWMANALPKVDNVADMDGLLAYLAAMKPTEQHIRSADLERFCIVAEESSAAAHGGDDAGSSRETADENDCEEEDDEEMWDEANDDGPAETCLFCPKTDPSDIGPHMLSAHGQFSLATALPKRKRDGGENALSRSLLCPDDCDRARVINFIRSRVAAATCPHCDEAFGADDNGGSEEGRAQLEAHLKKYDGGNASSSSSCGYHRLPKALPDGDEWLRPVLKDDGLLLRALTAEDEEEWHQDDDESAAYPMVATLGEVMNAQKAKDGDEGNDD